MGVRRRVGRLERGSNLLEALEGRTLLAWAPLGASQAVNDISAGEQSLAQAGSDAAGGFVVVWQSTGADGSSDVYARRFDADGTAAGPGFRVDMAADDQASSPAVAVEADGDFVVAWHSQRPGAEPVTYVQGLYVRRFDAAGNARGAEFRADASPEAVGRPVLAAADDGRFLVAWEQSRTVSVDPETSWTLSDVYARAFDPAGVPTSAASRVHSVNDPGGVPVSRFIGPVAVLDGGRFLVIWTTYANGDVPSAKAHARVYDSAGNPVGGALDIDSGGMTEARVSGAFAASGGGFALALSDGADAANHEDSRNGVLVRRFNASGAAQGTPVALAGFPLAGGVSVLADGTAGLLALWTEAEGNFSTYVQRYDAAGQPASARFRLPDGIGGAAAAMTRPAAFATLYTAADAEGTGVFLQRYSELSAAASVSGRAWHDLDADGVQDAAEPGQGGVAVELFTGAGVHAGSARTTADGGYSFDNVRPGEPHWLRFDLSTAEGLGAASPMDAGGDDSADSDVDPETMSSALFTLAAGETADLDAGGWQGVGITGVKFADFDLDGVRDAGEPPLAGWTIYVDLDEDGELDENEDRHVTANDGAFTFYVNPGTYRIAEVPQKHWGSVSPTGGAKTVTVTSGQALTMDFAAVSSVPFTPAGRVGENFKVNTTTASYEHGPKIATDADGDYVVVWRTYMQDASTRGVLAQRYDREGNKLGSEFYVTRANILDYDVAMGPDGGFAVVWNRNVSPGMAGQVLEGRVFDMQGVAHGEPFAISTAQDGAVLQATPSVAAGGDGGFVVAWVTGGIGIRARRIGASGQLEGEPILVRGLGETALSPDVAADAAGNFAVAWSTGVNYAVQRFDRSGGRIGEPILGVGQSFGTVVPAIAMDADGDFVVGWSQAHGQTGCGCWGPPAPTDWHAWVQRYDSAGTPQGARTHVAAVWDKHTGVSMDAAGNFVVTAAAGDGSDNGVYAQRFAANGLPMGLGFRANRTSVHGLQFMPSVAMDDEGDFIIAWLDAWQGSNAGWQGPSAIWAQRYANNTNTPPAPRPGEHEYLVGIEDLVSIKPSDLFTDPEDPLTGMTLYARPVDAEAPGGWVNVQTNLITGELALSTNDYSLSFGTREYLVRAIDSGGLFAETVITVTVGPTYFGTNAADTFYVAGRQDYDGFMQMWLNAPTTQFRTYGTWDHELPSLTLHGRGGVDTFTLDSSNAPRGEYNEPGGQIGFYPGGITLASSDGGDRVRLIAGITTLGQDLKLAGPEDGFSLELAGGARASIAGGYALVLGGLSIDSTSTLDVSDGRIVLTPPAGASAAALLLDVERLIARGRAGGTWGGTGITSSLAAADPGKLTGLVAFLRDGKVIVGRSYQGDADGDGRFTAADYFAIDRGRATRQAGYANGDFDYSGGTADASDYMLIDRSFLGQAGSLGSSPPQPGPVGQSAGNGGAAPVPLATAGSMFGTNAISALDGGWQPWEPVAGGGPWTTPAAGVLA